jgi:hypothetical protein
MAAAAPPGVRGARWRGADAGAGQPEGGRDPRLSGLREPELETLLITADSGGSNSYRARAWKAELQRLADETNLAISVSHFPPGTSKWNKIEHRLFCHITENWRARPLVDHETVVQLIGNTRTQTGLRVRARLDTHSYSIGIRIPDEVLSAVALEPENFHGEWNYTILPRPADSRGLPVQNV